MRPLFRLLTASLLFTVSFASNSQQIIEHALGTTVIDSSPQRIVTLYQGATDAAIALGIKPVGVVESWVEKPFYRYLRDDLEGAKVVGIELQPSLEEIARLKPDLIIASKVRHEKIYRQLSLIAPTVAHQTVFKFKETVTLVANAAGVPEKGEDLLEEWETRVSAFQAAMSKKGGWPVEATVINFRPDHARIYYSGFAGQVLNELGFVRPVAHQQDIWGVKLTSKESIPDMNADTFFIFMDDDDMVKETYRIWMAHPLWNTLNAVKKNQLFEVNSVAWNMGGGIIAANNMLDELMRIYQVDVRAAQ